MYLRSPFIVKILSLLLMVPWVPHRGSFAQDRPYAPRLFYRVQRGDALSEVLDRLQLRPIYPEKGSLRRTLAANSARLSKNNALLYPHQKIYFAPEDEALIRQRSEILASGEVVLGRESRTLASATSTPVPLPKVAQRQEPTLQKFSATEDEEGDLPDSFTADHSKTRKPSALNAQRPIKSKPLAADGPLDRDDDFPMSDAPIGAPRPSDTRSYESDF